jgi:hypothetical protein
VTPLGFSWRLERRTAMSDRIGRRDDVDPEEGERKYGEVEFADPVNKTYTRADTPGRCGQRGATSTGRTTRPSTTRARWRAIKARIERAAKRHGGTPPRDLTGVSVVI